MYIDSMYYFFNVYFFTLRELAQTGKEGAERDTHLKEESQAGSVLQVQSLMQGSISPTIGS